MINELESRVGRRDDIRQRLGSIDARLEELRAAWQDDPSPATSHERAALAQRHLAASQAAAGQAMVASAKAFRRAAAAHERAALRHERAGEAGSGDKDEHERRAALHRAAQARDAQRADRVESLVPDERRHEQDGKDVDTVRDKRLPLVVATPVEIDISTTDQLRGVLLDAAIRG